MVNSCSHVGTVSYLTTLCLGKSHRGSLPVLSDNSSPVTDNLATEEIFYSRKNVPDARVDLGTARLRSGHANDRATATGFLEQDKLTLTHSNLPFSQQICSIDLALISV